MLDTVTFDQLLVVGNPQPPPTDDHGDTISTATSILLGDFSAPSRTSGVLEVPGDADVFRFSVFTRGSVVVRTESAIDTVGELLDEFGNVLDLNDDRSSSDTNFQLEATLDPGTYFVRVTGYQGAVTGSYVLVAYFNPSGGGGGGGGGEIIPSFTATPTQGPAPLLVTFNAFNTVVPSGGATFNWAFGDGATATGLGATHTFVDAGIYTVTLTVRDPTTGAMASDSQQITVRQESSGGGGGGSIGPVELGLMLLVPLVIWFGRFRYSRRAGPSTEKEPFAPV